MEYYFAYAQKMATKTLSQRLDWSPGETKTYLERAKPQKASLKRYRLVFNKPTDDAPFVGLANIEESPNDEDTVEGVLYQLPIKVIEFLDRSESGYGRKLLALDEGGKQIQGYVYMAASTRAGLKPTRAYLQSMLAGATEYGLSKPYIEALRRQETLSSPDSAAPTMPPETDHTLKYFAYGANMYTDRLRQRVPSCTLYAVATLKGYSLRFHKRGNDGSGKCNALYTGNQDDQVIGAVFQIAQSEHLVLDRLEVGYHATPVNVVVGDKTVAAYMYEADSDTIDDTLRPYTWYREFVIAGAKEHKLPALYIQSLQAVPAQEDPDTQREEEQSELLLSYTLS